MIFFLIALAFVSLWGIKQTAGDYLSVEQTTAVKGIFACIIFCSHLKQYIFLEKPLDILYGSVLSYIGQLMVAIFFFYSGYGILLSYNTKKGYSKSFPVKRILKTWFHFATAVMIYLIVDIILGIKPAIKTIVLSFIGWESLGNSNWFVFDMLVLYMCVFIGFGILECIKDISQTKKNILLTGITLLLTIAVIYMLHKTKDTWTWWYDTLLSFPVGMVYYLIKNKLDKRLENPWIYLGSILLLVGIFVKTYVPGNYKIYNICAGVFCLLICWLTKKVQISNKCLKWLGTYSFYIYIYMRIPMIIFTHYGYNEKIYLFSLSCLIVTFIITFFMEKIQKRLDFLVLKNNG